MTLQTDSSGNDVAQRFPSLSKFGIAVLEHLVSKIVGESAVDEIKKPYAQKETSDSLGKALERAESQFTDNYLNENARQLLLQLPIHNLPAVKDEVWSFYKRPNDKDLENVLIEQLDAIGALDHNENKKIVNTYLSILRRELVNVDSEVRGKIQALALLEIAEDLKDVKDLLSYREKNSLSRVELQKPNNTTPKKILGKISEKSGTKVPSSQKKGEKWITRRYKVIETLGEGTFGVVSKAQDSRLNSLVAIKEMKLPHGVKEQQNELIQRFRREANALSRLRHPNIARIIDFGSYRKSLFIVMEFLPGATLQKRLGRIIPYSSAAGLLVPIAKALAYAHKEGFIHRDVKPGNILFTSTEEPILSDFGLVKNLRDENPSITQDGLTGTASYAAPEQFGGDVYFQSDIYALGIIYYEMITGKNPLVSMEFIERFTNLHLNRPSLHNTNLPDAVDEVIAHATAAKHTDRYGSMDDFLFDLRKLAVEKIRIESLPFMPIPIEEEESLRESSAKTKPQTPKGNELLSLVNKFEREINELIEQKDFPNAKRLIKVVDRLGLEGQQAAVRLRNKIPEQYL